MSGLTDAERTVLMQAAHRADLAGCSCESVFEAAEQIVARHVEAALTEAADVIDQWREMAVWAASHTEDPDQAQNSAIRSLAYRRASLIVRDLSP